MGKYKNMSEDPFPNKPSYEQLTSDEPSTEEKMKQGMDGSWYNNAPYVAARLIIEAARESDEFRQKLLNDDSFGVAHSMSEYDPERYEKLNSLSLRFPRRKC